MRTCSGQEQKARQDLFLQKVVKEGRGRVAVVEYFWIGGGLNRAVNYGCKE